MRKILLIIICILALILTTGCNTPEAQYQKLVKAINLGVSVEQVEEFLQKSKALGDEYKDNKQIRLCLESYKAISENKLVSASVYLFNNIPKDYSGEISRGIDHLRTVFKEKAIPEAEKLIKEQKYYDAMTLLNPVKDIEGFSQLWNYAAALEEIKNENMHDAIKQIYKISYFYDGPLADEIKKTKLDIEDMGKYKYIIRDAKPDPVLGMTMYEVEFDSSWGKPEKKNISTGSYGVHEQWVYGYGDYIYIENSIVTGIDESK